MRVTLSKRTSNKQVFYETNYATLLAIKVKYDLEDIMYGLTVVGSKAWTVAADGRLCKRSARSQGIDGRAVAF